MKNMENATLEFFEFEHHKVRVAVKDGEPWFIARDVCGVLGIGNVRSALGTLDDDEKLTVGLLYDNDKKGVTHFLDSVSVSGLYALIHQSKKPVARRFRKWVTAKVLPAVRRPRLNIEPLTVGHLIEHPEILDGFKQARGDLQKERRMEQADRDQAARHENRPVPAKAVKKASDDQGVTFSQPMLFISDKGQAYVVADLGYDKETNEGRTCIFPVCGLAVAQ